MFGLYLKKSFRNRTSLFWRLVFPIALMTLFTVAFSKIYDAENQLYPVTSTVVCTEESEFGAAFKEMLHTIDAGENGIEDGGTKFVILKEASDYDEAVRMLAEEEIKAIYKVDADSIDILLSKKCGTIDSMVARTVADSYLNNYGIIQKAVEMGNMEAITGVLEIVNSDVSTVVQKSGADGMDADPFQWYFYSTLVMAMLFNIQSGVYLMSDIQANLSRNAMRTAVSPLKKSKLVLSVFAADYLLENLISVVVLLAMKFVFGVEMGSRTGLLILFVLIGNLFAVSTGMVFATIFKGTEDQKANKVLGITMASVFLGGEMFANLPGYIEKSVPIINDINPATILNMAVYKVTNYDNLSGFYSEIIKITAVSVIMIVITIIKIRREKYASL